ncbi:uncharacterized protein [Henckelia pumila]|uniref:uncharacterized protein n=1 Tax=Henckelia pumila TaxID=405737 RepID=UPI003C6E0BC5
MDTVAEQVSQTIRRTNEHTTAKISILQADLTVHIDSRIDSLQATVGAQLGEIISHLNHGDAKKGVSRKPVDTERQKRYVSQKRDVPQKIVIYQHECSLRLMMKYHDECLADSGASKIIEGYGKAKIILPNDTSIYIENALYASKSSRNLLSFKDIRRNGYHIETLNENNFEYLGITSIISGQKQIKEKLCALPSGMYFTTIKAVEANTCTNQKFIDQQSFKLWHDRLGHPGATMMRKIIMNSHGHPLKNQKILLHNDYSCVACSQGKLIIRPSPTKVDVEIPTFLERIHGDICGPIHPPCGPFRYFMILIDASTRWSHVSLLSTRNIAFARLLAQIIKLRAQFPDYSIKKIRLDNAAEFKSQAFDEYCISIWISVEHSVAHVHTQNGLAEAFIKRLQLIARPLLMRTKLSSSAWGHAIIHAASLVRIRPTNYHQYSPLQLAYGREPDVSHLRVFGCSVQVPLPPTQRTKMGPQRRVGIYVGFDSPSIIRYLEPLTGDLFTARFADCHFDESEFPTLGVVKLYPEEQRKVSWNEKTLSHYDPRNNQSEQEVERIIHLQRIANQLPDAFVNTKNVTKSHIHAENTPVKIDVPVGPTNIQPANESKIRQKRGRPIGSKDTVPRKRKVQDKENSKAPEEEIPDDIVREINEPGIGNIPEELQIGENNEISTNYISSQKLWDRNNTIIDNVFVLNVAFDIMHNGNLEPQSVNDCQKRNDWPKWKEAIQAELDSLERRKVFGPVVRTPKNVIPVGYRWVFVRKRNANDDIFSSIRKS